jgi:transcriptional regulator with XRE-family HTH domain
MNSPLLSVLSPTELGRRIAQISKQLSLSQAEFAVLLGMPRSALTQVELGNRSIKVEELTRLAPHLPSTLNQFLDPSADLGEDRTVYARYHRSRPSGAEEPEVGYATLERNPIPVLHAGKLEQALRYFAQHVSVTGLGANSALIALMYFAEFQFYELYEVHFCGVTFQRVPHGLAASEVTEAVGQIRKELDAEEAFGGQGLKLLKPDLRVFNGAEYEVLRAVIDRFGAFDAAALVELVKRDLPWEATQDGANLDYELAWYREFPFSAKWPATNQRDAVRHWVESDSP